MELAFNKNQKNKEKHSIYPTKTHKNNSLPNKVTPSALTQKLPADAPVLIDPYRWSAYFKPFGVLCYVLREPKAEIHKLEEKLVSAIFSVTPRKIRHGSSELGRKVN